MSLHVDSIDDIATILEQLRATRQSRSDSAATRVATMNFVVFIDDPGRREWVLERAVRVADKHPSLLVVLDSTDATTGIAFSTLTRENGGLCVTSERFDLGVSALGHTAIHGLVQELSAPEVPTVLWWSGARLLQSRTFSGLAETAATVLVDSSGKVRGEETIRELGEFLTRFPAVVLQDLAFMRLSPWQEMIAQFFDDPALRKDLFSIDALDIESGSDAEALYLAGWLGSRLSWTPSGRHAFRDPRGGSIAFNRVDKGDQRRVLSVVLHAGDSTYRAALSGDDANVVALSVEGPKPTPVRYMPLGNLANAALIERAILENTRDEIFETSLRTVRDLLG